MKAYWKNHPALRMVLMLVLFVLAQVLVVSGWKMTGQLAGLGIMLVGVALLYLVRVCLCPCVVLAGGIVSGVDLGVRILELLREVGAVAVADGISTPLF